MPYDRHRLEVIAGDSFSYECEWQNAAGVAQSVASYDISVEFRKRTDSSSSLLTLTEGSGVTVAGDNLSFTFNVSPAQMVQMASDAGGTLGEDVVVLFDIVFTIGSTFRRTVYPGLLTIHADADR